MTGGMSSVSSMVQAAQKAGARCLLGGALPPPSAKGTFYPPTVLADVPHAHEVTREETFGPVVALSKFGPRRSASEPGVTDANCSGAVMEARDGACTGVAVLSTGAAALATAQL